ncbi:hypothetical protein [Patulibacter minatonensis]|uniref:hypothetical protein n=1 Tax=Patulibacter minatonensis TaxID=298163 RepID=UPI00047ADC6B|nr:hypothetical protein [Patulibacter minatonensis]
MSPLIDTTEHVGRREVPLAVVPDRADIAPQATSVQALRQEVESLRREVTALRIQRQRDMATARGLGEALQSLRRGALALRQENEELRRRVDGRPSRRR